MVYTISEIAKATGAQISGKSEGSGKFKILIDSRTLTDPENTIFFALRSNYNDGNKYIPELISKGVKIFVSDREFNTVEDITLLKVNNTLQALQDLAGHHRKKFTLPVIGITGSNGKTVVKEWLLQTMSPEIRICSSPKSYNSQIGVPLSVWQLEEDDQLGIFEAGISNPGEMEKLEKIISPEIGVLTHLGSAHNEGFDSYEHKLEEKLKLFVHCKTVICIYDEDIVGKLGKKVLTYGFNQLKADLNITKVNRDQKGSLIEGNFKDKKILFSIPFIDGASLENACLCALINLHLNMFEAERFRHLHPVSMRMELKKGIHNCILINDSYSNDLNALGTALSFLKQQALHPKLTVILSDIEESGLSPDILYDRIYNLLNEKQITRLIGIGQSYLKKQSVFSGLKECSFFPDTAAFLNDFYKLNFSDESILIKGARRYGFESIVRKLEQVTHGTVLEIDLSAALKNLNAIKNRIPAGTKLMAMVKAFAYGSGSYEIAKLLQNKVDYLAVAYTDEGIALKSGIRTPVMVMNPDDDSSDLLTEYDLEPVIFNIDGLNKLSSSLHRPLKVHIEIDTGMHRLGFMPEAVDELCEHLKILPNIHVASVFSHLAASDEEMHDDFTMLQFESFSKVAKKIQETLNYPILKHISNTAASLRFNQNDFDLVRIGIGLYGIDPTGKYSGLLEPVFTLKSHISQIKDIAANESIGYSRKSRANHPRRIAVLALGYADGLNRALSNGAAGFYINGQYAPISGNICMDMCMVDVTDIKCSEGDEAILFGKEHSISDLAARLNTIPYEILTSISQRVKRVYVSE